MSASSFVSTPAVFGLTERDMQTIENILKAFPDIRHVKIFGRGQKEILSRAAILILQ